MNIKCMKGFLKESLSQTILSGDIVSKKDLVGAFFLTRGQKDAEGLLGLLMVKHIIVLEPELELSISLSFLQSQSLGFLVSNLF